MRAAVVTTFGGPEAVRVVEAEVPEPAAGQVRIKVAAAPLNPVDAKVRTGVFGGEGRQFGLGLDAAGTIDAAGADTGWSVGETVVVGPLGVGPGDVRATGTHAEYVLANADAVAKAPAGVDAVHAATLPLNGLTAAQALDLLALEPGQSLLVTGAAGAVGGYAVQLAVRQGVEVTALAREADADLVRSLGAAHHVTTGDGRRFDAVLDAALLNERALAWVRDGGAFVGVVPGVVPPSVRGVRTALAVVRPDHVRLAELVALVEAGALTLRVAETYPLDEAAKAHARLAEGGVRGRIVLIP